jgi:anti-sigma B factor antagonist
MHLALAPDSVGRTTLTVAGEVDLAVAGELIRAGCEQVALAPSETLYLDLSGVTFMDSTALSALITIRNAASAPVVLVRPSPSVLRLLQLTALDQAFTIEPDGSGSAP